MIQDMKFLVLQHINIEHPGIFLDFMKKDKIHIDTVELDEGEKIPKLDSYDAMIVMGGPMDTWQEETYPWLKTEKEEIHKFVSVMKKPFLGLCLGAQLLSEVVGGKVRKMNTPEIGVMDISITNNSSIFSGMNKNLKVLQWHSYEVCDLPKNTELVFLFANPASPMPGAKRRKDGTKRSHAEWANKNKFTWYTEETLPESWR